MTAEVLPIGTRIRFTQTLDQAPTSDQPALLFARKGQFGEITGHGTLEGYWVKADGWPVPFGASRDEFEILISKIQRN